MLPDSVTDRLPVTDEQTDLTEVWYRPFDLRLRLRSNSPAILAVAHSLFGRFGATAGERRADLRFVFVQRPGNGPLNKPVYREEGALVSQQLGDQALLVANRETGEADGFFSDAVVADPPFFRTHFLELAFYTMLGPRGLMGVHAAALARNGRGILLRAESGGGKTTLAYAGARRSYQALAEDVLWMDIERGIWWGMPWRFHLLPDARRLFPELAPYRPVLQTNEELKLEVSMEAVRPGGTTFSALPGPVVLVTRTPGCCSRLEALDLAAARPLWDRGAAGTERRFPDYDRHVDRLLSGNAYRLYFGDDVDHAVDLLEPLFD